jgi:hypothetical protein
MRAIEYCGTPNGDLPRGKSYPVAKGGIERPWADFACRFAPREIRWPRAELNHRHKDFQTFEGDTTGCDPARLTTIT